MCGELNKSLQGTRDAAQNWEHEYMEAMQELGFKVGRISPCTFWHPNKEIRAVVHGDDFTLLADEDKLDWFRREISKKLEVKFRGRNGPDSGDDKSIRVLSRVVTWTIKGIKYEADQRHVEIILKQLSLEEASKPVSTPGIKQDGPEDPADAEELGKQEATAYRGITARANYVCQDRSDIQFAVKELSRGMASPTVGDRKQLKRFGRYLISRPRVVMEYNYQDEVKQLDGWTDSDYAGCRKTRKSTSGGLIMLGSHVLKSWSSTQAIIALSSGEAEYYSIVKGSSIGLGIKRMLEDMGIKMKLTISTDASAAKGISARRGAGKIRHIEVSQLWVQQKVRSGEIIIKKVRTDENLADALTKHVAQYESNYHIDNTGLIIASGRHDLAPEVNYVERGQSHQQSFVNYSDNQLSSSSSSERQPNRNYGGQYTHLKATVSEEECRIILYTKQVSHSCSCSNYDSDPWPLLAQAQLRKALHAARPPLY